MGYKGLTVLQHLSKNNLIQSIELIKSSRDNNLQEDFYEDIADLSKSLGLKFFDINDICSIQTEFTLAVSWRWMINSFNNKLIVFHDSILPKYRGFAPLVSSLIKGEKYIGVSVFWATEKFDEGDIIAQKVQEVTYPIKIIDAIMQISELYGNLACEVVNAINNNTKLPINKQDTAKATYSLWLDHEDYRIDWNNDSHYIKRFIDSVGYPYLSAFTTVADDKIRVIDSEIVEDIAIENRKPGKVLRIENGEPVVVCGNGLIKIKKAIFEETKKTFLPLKILRTRFY